MKQTIKNITLTRLVQIFLVSIFIIISVVALTYRSMFENLLVNETTTISKAVKAGLTAHMKADIMDKKQYFLDEISTINNIEQINITKIDSNISYPKSIKHVLDTKQSYFELNDIDGKFQATIPYIATSTDELNCISCHNVQNGDIVGVISLGVDITDTQRIVIEYGYLLVGVLMFFALLILLNLSSLIDQYISTPLSHVIEEGEEAFRTKNSLNTDDYESDELEKVALSINKFNHDILLKENEIYAKNIELKALNEEIESTLRETMLAIGEIEEIRSSETKYHTARVAKLSALIAREYGLSEKQVKLIELTSVMHDIGKVGIGDDILEKPGKLTANEFEIMKGHTELGHKVLRHSSRPILQAAADIAYSHHEKYNGKGYPQGLKGDEIPVFARIVAIVDVLDALLCKRIYKDPWTKEDVRTLLIKERGEHFEEKLVDIVVGKLDEYAKIIKDMS